VVLGAILFVAGLIDHWVVAPKSALCQSGIGQIGQAIDTTVAHDCGLVNALEAAVGWLLVLGVLAVIFGLYVIYNSRAVAQPVPATPWSGPPSPYAPPAQPYAAPPAQPYAAPPAQPYAAPPAQPYAAPPAQPYAPPAQPYAAPPAQPYPDQRRPQPGGPNPPQARPQPPYSGPTLPAPPPADRPWPPPQP
jgi:hypothetical protein